MARTLKTLSIWSFVSVVVSLIFYYFHYSYVICNMKHPILWICALLISPFILFMLGLSLRRLAKAIGSVEFFSEEMNKKIDTLQTELEDLRKGIKENKTE